MTTACIALLFAATLCAQERGPSVPGTRPRFVAADVHTAPAPAFAARPIPIHDDRYELKSASMLDLIVAAYGWEAEKIVGGPNWLEMEYFDVIAKLPGETSADDRKLMLQRLLEDRFKLVVHQDTRPVPGYVLTAGKHPALRKAAGSEKNGCVPYASPTPSSMDLAPVMNGSNPIHITIGPGSTVTYNCRNVTMNAFAQGLHDMFGANLNPGPVSDATGLKGGWDFDVHWTQQYVHLDRSPLGHTTVFDALDQQLGLKLEERPVPAPALVVDRVNRTPTPNVADLARVLPPIPTVTKFEVASVKPSDPRSTRQNMRLEAARVTIEDYPMNSFFQMTMPGEIIEKMPDWVYTATFDVMATAPGGMAALTRTNIAPPMLALLKDRFRLAYHTEQRPRPAYVMEAVKPKMKKADPGRRASCRRDTAPSGEQGFLTRFTCQNVTMGQFAEWFSNHGIGLKFWANGVTVVSDGTGLSGAWDFTLVYDPMDRMAPPPDQLPATSEPGGAYTIFEAMQRQLGLKLMATTKPGPVIVIDHLDRKPTEQ